MGSLPRSPPGRLHRGVKIYAPFASWFLFYSLIVHIVVALPLIVFWELREPAFGCFFSVWRKHVHLVPAHLCFFTSIWESWKHKIHGTCQVVIDCDTPLWLQPRQMNQTIVEFRSWTVGVWLWEQWCASLTKVHQWTPKYTCSKMISGEMGNIDLPLVVVSFSLFPALRTFASLLLVAFQWTIAVTEICRAVKSYATVQTKQLSMAEGYFCCIILLCNA